ncbi:MAG: hypothetical protein J7M26_00055 [Armatimonadetes bacterium]|nr:hypothetical protein [Armatimonadota bacterium]
MAWTSAPGHSKAGRGGRRRGQVLLIAVLLMTVVLLMGILFVAIVNYNQHQSARHGDMLLARSLAEAAIHYADYMLQKSPLGADWRPPRPPMMDVALNTYDPGFWGSDDIPQTEDDYYLPEEIVRGYHGLYNSTTGEVIRIGFTRYPDRRGGGGGPSLVEAATMGQGHALLRVVYDPDPPFEASDTSTTPEPLSKYIKIEAVGVVEGRAAVQQHLVAYKPIGLTDYLIWVTDRTDTGKTAHLGAVPWDDLDGSGTLDIHGLGSGLENQGEFLVSQYNGPIRVDAHLRLIGGNLSGSPLSGAPLDPDQASNQIVLTTTPIPRNPDGTPKDPSNPNDTPYGGYLRDDAVEVRYGIEDPAQGTPGMPVPGQTTAVKRQYWNGSAVASDPTASTVWPSDTSQFSTYNGLVRDGQESTDSAGYSRFVAPLAAPDVFSPDPLTGEDRYRALTRDSGAPVAGPSGITYTGAYGHGDGLYVDNYSELQFVNNDGTHDLDALIDDWLQEIPRGDPRAADSGWNALRTVYIPPGVEVELYDSESALAGGRPIVTADVNPKADPAYTVGGAKPIWWPRHQAGQPGIRLIRHDQRWLDAAGNDSGLNEMAIDYPQWPNAVIFAEGNIRIRGILPPAQRNLAGDKIRDYGLTVVSGGTIYIDGQLLSPRDVDPTLRDEDEPKIALIARDHVCLNTTMLVPQMTSGTVPAAPDDPANPDPDKLHWALSSGAGYLWSTWVFGAPMAGELMMHVLHTAADPGPSGVGMYVRNPATGAMVPFAFDPAQGVPDVYAFVPPGVPLLDVYGNTLPGTHTIAPTWEVAGAARPGIAAWNLSAFVDGSAGVYNMLSFFQKDPQVAPGSTDYWAKRWKIQEWVNFDRPRPVATLHARINALIYAQNGCWFVIPGSYFDPEAGAADVDNDGIEDSVEYRRYNYDITVRGAITQNYTAPPEAEWRWRDKWAYPSTWVNGGGTWHTCWGTIRYEYDETLRAGRDQPLGQVTNGTNVRVCGPGPTPPTWNMPRVPVLPVSPSLIYYGQAW